MRDTQRVSLLPLSLICKGDDKKLRLFSRVSLGTLSFIFQGCETKSTSSPRLWEHPLCHVVVAAVTLVLLWKPSVGADSSRLARVGWKLIESPSPKPTGQEGAGATLKLVFLYVKSKERFALDAALSNGIRFLVWLELKSTLTLVNKYRVNWILTVGCTYFGIWKLPGWW